MHQFGRILMFVVVFETLSVEKVENLGRHWRQHRRLHTYISTCCSVIGCAATKPSLLSYSHRTFADSRKSVSPSTTLWHPPGLDMASRPGMRSWRLDNHKGNIAALQFTKFSLAATLSSQTGDKTDRDLGDCVNYLMIYKRYSWLLEFNRGEALCFDSTAVKPCMALLFMVMRTYITPTACVRSARTAISHVYVSI